MSTQSLPIPDSVLLAVVMSYVDCGDDGKWSNDSACCVVHDVRLYSVLDTVVMSGDDVCCSVVFGTLVGVFVFSGPSC